MKLDKLKLENTNINRITPVSPDTMVSKAVAILQRSAKLPKNTARILIYLVQHSNSTGKEISKGLRIPDSKVYPALSQLQELGVILSQDERPAKYSVFEIDYIIEELVKEEEKRLNQFKADIRELESIFVELWNPEMGNRLPVSYIVKENLGQELTSFIKSTKKHLQIIVSESIFSSIHESVFVQLLLTILRRESKVMLAIPAPIYLQVLSDGVNLMGKNIDVNSEDLEELRYYMNNSQLILKKSEVQSSSYFIKDHQIAAHVMHHQVQAFAIITTDLDFVSIINSCWKEGSTCINF